MCGRFASRLPAEELVRLFGTRNAPPNVPPSWNLAPSQQSKVVRRHPETGERHLDALSWGLLPSWTKKDTKPQRPINARAETIDLLLMFRDAFRRRRAIVPMDAFYKWHRPKGRAKQPYAIARVYASPLAIAGLWESHKRAGER